MHGKNWNMLVMNFLLTTVTCSVMRMIRLWLFSPYNVVPKVIDVSAGYDVEVSDYSIYSYGTKTIVMRCL